MLDTLRRGGRYVFYGATLGNPGAGLALAKLFLRQNRLQGSTMGTPEEFRAMLQFVTEQGIVPVVDSVYALEEALAAHLRMQAGEHSGKIVLRMAAGEG